MWRIAAVTPHYTAGALSGTKKPPQAVAGEECFARAYRVASASEPWFSVLAGAAAVAALEDTDWLAQNSRQIIEDRDWLTGALQYYGFQVLPSLANFVFARHRNFDAAKLATGLRERKILVRHFDKSGISDWLRITVGTRAQCEALADAVEALTKT